MRMEFVALLILLNGVKIQAQEIESTNIEIRPCSDYSLIEMLRVPEGERCLYKRRSAGENGEQVESALVITKISNLKIGGKWGTEDGKMFFKQFEFYAAGHGMFAVTREPVDLCQSMNKEMISAGYYCETKNGEGYELISQKETGRIWYSYASGYFWFEPNVFGSVNYQDAQNYCSLLSGEYHFWEKSEKLIFSIAKRDWVFFELNAGIDDIFQWPTFDIWTNDFNGSIFSTILFQENRTMLTTSRYYNANQSYGVFCRGGVDK